MTDWCIRPYHPDDAGAICRIYNYYVCETDISFEVQPVTVNDIVCRADRICADGAYLVVEQAGEVMGYAYAKPWHTLPAYAHTFESTIYLAHDRNRQACKGMGSALYAALLEVLRQQGKVRILFGVPTLGNVASDRLHEKSGFTRQAVFHQVGYKRGRWLGVTYWSYDFGQYDGSEGKYPPRSVPL